MNRENQGRLIPNTTTNELFYSYVPNKLPPVPSIDISSLSVLLERAGRAIGELNGVVQTLIDPYLLTYLYVRKEALLSSQIEGTQSTLDDLLRYESDQMEGVPVEDAKEVSSYAKALSFGIEELRKGFPLCTRLIRSVHMMLLHNTRGRDKMPGEIRRTQNWIGGTRPGNARFVPAPPDMLMDALGDLEKFMNDDDTIPLLIQAAVIHQQFETIHPFLDGNGRVGRLLITLFLIDKKVIDSPFLYVSLYFKKHRQEYYTLLDEVRKTGDWENWIAFFLESIISTAADVKATVFAVMRLFANDNDKISTLKRARKSALAVFEVFTKRPVLSVSELCAAAVLSKPTVILAVNNLIKLGILADISDTKWRRIYIYKDYVRLLSKDDEPL